MQPQPQNFLRNKKRETIPPRRRFDPATLGFRAEDASVSSTAAELNIQVYSLELLGDSTMVTARVGESLVAVKSSKDYSVAIGAEVGIHITASICHLFDTHSGQRFEEHQP